MWDVLEIDWSGIKVTFNGKVFNLPKSLAVKLWDKFKVRHMMEKLANTFSFNVETRI